MFAPNGAWFASASTDGSIRIWDTVTGRLVKAIEAAHDALGQMTPVDSIKWSSNAKYILSKGKDNVGKLFDWQTGRAVRTYLGADNQVSLVLLYRHQRG